VLHPSFTLAARELYDINTELFASPPYLSPHLTNHQLRSPHPHLATMTPSTWTETQRAIGITQVNDPLLHEAIQQAHRINTQDTSCTILIIIGALTPRVTLILAQYPPTETSHHMASSLPQPHVELLNGTQGSTIALSARLPEQCTILRFGHGGPSISTFLNHRALQPLIPSHSTTPTEIAHANTMHKLIGNTFQWFAPALQPPQNQIAINGIPPQPQDAPANNDLPPSPNDPPLPPSIPKYILREANDLIKYPRDLAARGVPPMLLPLLHAIHIPGLDLLATKTTLYRQWIRDLTFIHTQYMEALQKYASIKGIHLNPLALKHNNPHPPQEVPLPAPPQTLPPTINPPGHPFHDHPLSLPNPHPTTRYEAKRLNKLRLHLTTITQTLTGDIHANTPCGGYCTGIHQGRACKIREKSGRCLRQCNHTGTTPCIICGGCRAFTKQGIPTQPLTAAAKAYYNIAKHSHCECAEYKDSWSNLHPPKPTQP